MSLNILFSTGTSIFPETCLLISCSPVTINTLPYLFITHFTHTIVLPFLCTCISTFLFHQLSISSPTSHHCILSFYHQGRREGGTCPPEIPMLKKIYGFLVNILLQWFLAYISSASRGFAPEPHPSAPGPRWGTSVPTSQSSPSKQIYGYAPVYHPLCYQLLHFSSISTKCSLDH